VGGGEESFGRDGYLTHQVCFGWHYVTRQIEEAFSEPKRYFVLMPGI